MPRPQRSALHAVSRLLRRQSPRAFPSAGRAYSSNDNSINTSNTSRNNTNTSSNNSNSNNSNSSIPGSSIPAPPWYGRASSASTTPLPPRYSSITPPSPFAKGQRTYPASPASSGLSDDDLEKLRSLGFKKDTGNKYWANLLNFPELGVEDPDTTLADDLKVAPLPVRLKPVSGKVFHVNAGLPVMAAFGALNRLCAVEGISPMWRRQRFHERGGLKRKRLKSERWRARFAAGFSATVQRVQYLTRQGW